MFVLAVVFFGRRQCATTVSYWMYIFLLFLLEECANTLVCARVSIDDSVTPLLRRCQYLR